jgi:hypothetical protein
MNFFADVVEMKSEINITSPYTLSVREILLVGPQLKIIKKTKLKTNQEKIWQCVL